MSNELEQQTIEARAAVYRWYRLLDVHAPIAEVTACLSPQVELVFPEGPMSGLKDFEAWYAGTGGRQNLPGVINLFFDEAHELKYLRVALTPLVENDAAEPCGWRAEVELVVRWQARRWKPPAATSDYLAFDAWQRWRMERMRGGPWLVHRYIVDRLEPLAGSATL